MKEISNHYSCPQISLLADTVVINNTPDYCYGLNFLQHTRFVLFEEAGGHHYIDFVEYDTVPNAIYVIPPSHFHYLDAAHVGNYITVDIDNSLLQLYHKKFLYYLKYNEQKKLLPLPGNDNGLVFNDLVAIAEKKYHNRQIIQLLEKAIEQRVAEKLLKRFKSRQYAHIEKADQFLDLLQNYHLSHDKCLVESLAAQLYCSERTLLRTCLASFGRPTKDILQYHLTTKATYLLLSSDDPVTRISKKLGFSDVTVFNRYMKRCTRFTPTELREQLKRIGL